MSKEFTVEENLEYLKKQMKYAGFGDRMNEKLETAIAEALLTGKKEITLDPDVTYHKTPLSLRDEQDTYNKLEASPNLTQREGSGLFNFNNYKAVLTKPDGSSVQQFVSTEYGKSYTVKEIANALDNGAVFKTWKNIKNEPYNGWKWLNMDQLKENGNHKEHIKHESYSFNMDKEMDKQKIRYFNDEHRNDIKESLQRGNFVEIYIDNDEGKVEQRFLRANPAEGQLDSYAIKDGELIQLNKKQDEGQKQSETKETTKPGAKEKEQEHVVAEKTTGASQQAGQEQKQDKGAAATQHQNKAPEPDKKKVAQQNREGTNRRNRPRERAPESNSRGKGKGK